MVLLIDWTIPREHRFLKVNNPQEPLLCGLRVGFQTYVTDYEIKNQYVIDLDHGGAHNVWHCRAFKGELEPTGNGR